MTAKEGFALTAVLAVGAWIGLITVVNGWGLEPASRALQAGSAVVLFGGTFAVWLQNAIQTEPPSVS